MYKTIINTIIGSLEYISNWQTVPTFYENVYYDLHTSLGAQSLLGTLDRKKY